MKEFWKWEKSWQNYGIEFGCSFLAHPVVLVLLQAYLYVRHSGEYCFHRRLSVFAEKNSKVMG